MQKVLRGNAKVTAWEHKSGKKSPHVPLWAPYKSPCYCVAHTYTSTKTLKCASLNSKKHNSIFFLTSHLQNLVFSFVGSTLPVAAWVNQSLIHNFTLSPNLNTQLFTDFWEKNTFICFVYVNWNSPVLQILNIIEFPKLEKKYLLINCFVIRDESLINAVRASLALLHCDGQLCCLFFFFG